MLRETSRIDDVFVRLASGASSPAAAYQQSLPRSDAGFSPALLANYPLPLAPLPSPAPAFEVESPSTSPSMSVLDSADLPPDDMVRSL